MKKMFQLLLLGSAIALTGPALHAADRGLGVNVSIGGKKGVKANVSLGGRKGINAGVDASIGGRKGVRADVDVAVGGKKGVDADARISLGGMNANIDTRDDVAVHPPGADRGKDPDGGALTTAQRQAFNSMSAREKTALLKRCGSIGRGGYDPALVRLCQLLRMSASR